MTEFEFHCAIDGYIEKQDEEDIRFRNLAAITHASMGGKSDIFSIWKLRSESTDPVKEFTQAEIDQITMRVNMPRQKVKQ